MPTVLRMKGFRFFFYASDNGEPCHIHVSKGEGIGKVWLEPTIEIQYLTYFTVQQKKEVLEIIEANELFLIEKWYEFFSK